MTVKAEWSEINIEHNRKTTAFEVFPSSGVKVTIGFYENHFHGNLDHQKDLDELDDSHDKLNGL